MRASSPSNPSIRSARRSGTSSISNPTRYQTATGYAASGSVGSWNDQAPATTGSQSAPSGSPAYVSTPTPSRSSAASHEVRTSALSSSASNRHAPSSSIG